MKGSFEGRETGRGKRVVPGRIEEGNFLNGNLNGVGQIDDRNLGIKLNGQFAAGELIRGEFTSEKNGLESLKTII